MSIKCDFPDNLMCIQLLCPFHSAPVSILLACFKTEQKIPAKMTWLLLIIFPKYHTRASVIQRIKVT